MQQKWRASGQSKHKTFAGTVVGCAGYPAKIDRDEEAAGQTRQKINI